MDADVCMHTAVERANERGCSRHTFVLRLKKCKGSEYGFSILATWKNVVRIG